MAQVIQQGMTVTLSSSLCSSNPASQKHSSDTGLSSVSTHQWSPSVVQHKAPVSARLFVCCVSVSVSLNREWVSYFPQKERNGHLLAALQSSSSPQSSVYIWAKSVRCWEQNAPVPQQVGGCCRSQWSSAGVPWYGAVFICLQFCLATFQMSTAPSSAAILLYRYKHTHRWCIVVELRTSSYSEATSLNCCMAFVAHHHQCHWISFSLAVHLSSALLSTLWCTFLYKINWTSVKNALLFLVYQSICQQVPDWREFRDPPVAVALNLVTQLSTLCLLLPDRVPLLLWWCFGSPRGVIFTFLISWREFCLSVAPPLHVKPSVCNFDILISVEVKLHMQRNEGKHTLGIPSVFPPIISDVVLIVCSSVGVCVELSIAAAVFESWQWKVIEGTKDLYIFLYRVFS